VDRDDLALTEVEIAKGNLAIGKLCLLIEKQALSRTKPDPCKR
jgi:hypothetical protein